MQPRTAEQQSRVATRLVTREQAKRRRLDALGIDFEFEGASPDSGPADSAGYKATAEAMTSARKLGAANAVAVGQGTDADKFVAKTTGKPLPTKRKLSSRVRKSI